MTQGERVKEARKSLGLTLDKFGERIGLKKSALSLIENGKNELTDGNVLAICREYNVSEKWIRDGVEPIFIQPDSFSLDEFATAHHATDLEKEIVKAYFRIDPDTRKKVLDHFRECFMGSGGVPDTPEELEAMYPPVKKGEENAG